jgi:hypothetical protein
MFFGARDDVYATQPGDGYAAMVGGVKLVSTEAQGSLFGGKAVGTIPHALIAIYGGDTLKATKRFAEAIEGVDVIALVDYDNDSVKASLEVARALEDRLWGVRLDTAETMVDKSVVSQMGAFKPTGVNANLVWNVRNALDAEGFGDVKIVVSAASTWIALRRSRRMVSQVDAYGVGAALFDGRFDYTAGHRAGERQAAGEGRPSGACQPATRAGEVMASVRLDGAGMAKMKTLDEAMLLLQRIHGLVEMYAMAIKRGQPAGPFVQNLRRTFPTLSENLKGQFGMIADQVMAVNLSTSRGASENRPRSHAARRRRANQTGSGDRRYAGERPSRCQGRIARQRWRRRCGLTGDVRRCRGSD